MVNRSFISPDRSHVAELIYKDEIRFGPPYYTLLLDGGRETGDRIFGDSGLWSPDSKYFAAQEWLSTAYSAGPHTRLLVIDVSRRCEAVVHEFAGGFIEPIGFEGPVLHFEHGDNSSHKQQATRGQIALTHIAEWTSLR